MMFYICTAHIKERRKHQRFPSSDIPVCLRRRWSPHASLTCRDMHNGKESKIWVCSNFQYKSHTLLFYQLWIKAIKKGKANILFLSRGLLHGKTCWQYDCAGLKDDLNYSTEFWKTNERLKLKHCSRRLFFHYTSKCWYLEFGEILLSPQNYDVTELHITSYYAV